MASISECHESEYECPPAVIAQAPGRFHLLGEHTWFAGGITLSMAINSTLSVAISPRSDAAHRIYFATTGEHKKVSPSNVTFRREDRWVNSLKAVISAFAEDGASVPGLNITIQTDIPLNAGLGNPNAMKTALAIALRALLYDGKKRKISDNSLISLLEAANRRYLSVHPHRADLFCAFHAKQGNFIMTDLRGGTCEHVAFPSKKHSILLVDTKVPRALAREEFNERVQECIDAYNQVRNKKDAPPNFSSINESFIAEMPGISESVRREAIFVLNESNRAESAAQFLRAKDYAAFSKAVIRSHEDLRDKFEISCPELDWVAKRALEFFVPENPDLVCARLTGRGFGGCAYVILPTENVEAFNARLGEYERIFGFTPVVYHVRPSGGAALL